MTYIPRCIPEEDLSYYRKARMGNRSGYGKKPSLIVVDMTREYTEDAFSYGCGKTGQPAVKAIKNLLDICRDRKILTIFTKVPTGSSLETGCWEDKMFPAPRTSVPNPAEANDISPLIAPREGEIVLVKAHASAFFGTQLVSILTHEHVDTIIVTGMVTSGCVFATVIDGFSYNFKVIVPLECSHEVALYNIDQKYGDVEKLDDVVAKLKELI